MNSKIILCTGGARSGKSEFAERLALSLYKKETAYDEYVNGQTIQYLESEESSALIDPATFVGSGVSVDLDSAASDNLAALLYVATGQAFDNEMKSRIANHRERRGSLWDTQEIPHNLEAHWRAVLDSHCSIILLDCLTMYVTNCLLELKEPYSSQDIETLQQRLADEFTRIMEATRSKNKTLIMVTNEVGSGIVPGNALSRHFRDVAGYVNQQVAALADEVYLTVSGITIEIKSKEVRI